MAELTRSLLLQAKTLVVKLVLALSALKTAAFFRLPSAYALFKVVYLFAFDDISQVLLNLSFEIIELGLLLPELLCFFRIHLSCQLLQVDSYYILSDFLLLLLGNLRSHF